MQRWLLTRRQYTTVTGAYKPGRIDLGAWNPVIVVALLLVLFVLIAVPLVSLVLGSFMTRSGIFILDPLFTTQHWKRVLTDRIFLNSLYNTLWIAGFAALSSPLLFSFLAYVIVRTRWLGRNYLDGLIWFSAVIPGMLSGLGLLWLFLRTPFLVPLYGTLLPLMLVVLIQGKTTGVQISKAVFLQIGKDMEEQARVSGAGWFRTYFRIWLPLLAPTLALLATMNFMMAANAISSIILLAPRGTETMAILAIEFAEVGRRESAGIVSLLIMLLSVGLAIVVRSLSLRARRY
jgi:iron(III) transport system permease protein